MKIFGLFNITSINKHKDTTSIHPSHATCIVHNALLSFTYFNFMSAEKSILYTWAAYHMQFWGTRGGMYDCKDFSTLIPSLPSHNTHPFHKQGSGNQVKAA